MQLLLFFWFPNGSLCIVSFISHFSLRLFFNHVSLIQRQPIILINICHLFLFLKLSRLINHWCLLIYPLLSSQSLNFSMLILRALWYSLDSVSSKIFPSFLTNSFFDVFMELAFSTSCTLNVTVYLTVMYILGKLDLAKRIFQCVKKLLDEITTKIENYAKIK